MPLVLPVQLSILYPKTKALKHSVSVAQRSMAIDPEPQHPYLTRNQILVALACDRL